MKPELASAINFVLGHLYNKLPRRRVDIFAEELEKAMEMKFAGHWYPGCPNKGSGYRCMRVSQTLLDPAIAIAIHESGLHLDDIVGNLPEDLMVWVDPGEVSYRAGEKGIVTIIYREKNKEPRVNPESDLTSAALDASVSDSLSISPTGSSIPSPVTVLEPLEITPQPQGLSQQQVSPQQSSSSSAQMSPQQNLMPQPSQLSPQQQPQMHHAPPQLVAPIPLLPVQQQQHQTLPLAPGPMSNSAQQLLQHDQFNYNPDAKEFLPMDNLTSSLGNMQMGSPRSTPLGYPPIGQLGFHPIAPMPQKPRPVSAPNTARPSSLTFTAASFAQTKFGSTKLKSSGKRVNFQQLSPTEFANYMKQRSAMKSFRGQRSPVNSRGDFSTIQPSKDESIIGWLDHTMPSHQQTSPAALSPEPQQTAGGDPFANNGWMYYDGWSTTAEQYTPNSLIAAN